MATTKGTTRRPRRARRAGDPQPGLAAKFEGDCGRCPRPIRLGDRIVFMRGSAIHASCASGQDDK